MCVCVCVYLGIYVSLYTHTHTHTHTLEIRHLRIPGAVVCPRIYIHTYIYNIHTYIRTDIMSQYYTYIYTRNQTPQNFWGPICPGATRALHHSLLAHNFREAKVGDFHIRIRALAC